MATLPRTHPIKQSPLHKLGHHKRLASLLKIEVAQLRGLAKAGSAAYSEWDEDKPNGGTRRIENPKPRLKRLQSRLATILSLIDPPAFLSCPVKGRSYISNARAHLGSKEFVTLDVKSYFPSTTWNRVYWYFNKRLLMPRDTAWTLASVATIDGRLPTGSPLSPIMAYLAHEDMWLKVAKLAEDVGCRLTVYMDDITISGARVPEATVWKIKQEVHKVGLRLNDKKERRFSDVGVITGVVVTPDGVRLPKRSHLNLSIARKAALVVDGEAKLRAMRRVRGLEAQHRQVLAPTDFTDNLSGSHRGSS
ncbi:reverse transcriptase family protein [Caulobacter endophyticus]|nr:reverse transcriptase family protein [Caulobacter endophyticus]